MQEGWTDAYPWQRPSGYPAIGHYTQVVWAETTKIGCGYVAYDKDGYKQVKNSLRRATSKTSFNIDSLTCFMSYH